MLTNQLQSGFQSAGKGLYYHGISQTRRLGKVLKDSSNDIYRNAFNCILFLAISFIIFYHSFILMPSSIGQLALVLYKALVFPIATFASFATCCQLQFCIVPTMNTRMKESYMVKSTRINAEQALLPLLHIPQRDSLVRTSQYRRTKQSMPGQHNSASINSNPQSSPDQLLLSRKLQLRLRILEHPIINVVPGETRSRCDFQLFKSKVSIGKAHIIQTPKIPTISLPFQLQRQGMTIQDIYMIRVDCTQSSRLEKHMNPVVMWDFSATYEEFHKLENQLKAEIKKIYKVQKVKLSKPVIPHLSGGFSFGQKELTDDILHSRREKLQIFINHILLNKELADSQSMRIFCQMQRK